MANDVTIEALRGEPGYLALGAWQRGGETFEIVSRPRLDGRQTLPFFVHEGHLYAGVLERERASRLLSGSPLVGWEPIGIDFGGVDETGDVLSYGKAIFTERAGVAIDEEKLKIPLPSYAKSIGYLSELALPLLVPIVPPDRHDLSVTWDGATHAIRFRPVTELARRLRRGDLPYAEDLLLLLGALSPAARSADDITAPPATAAGARFVAREAARIATADALSAELHGAVDTRGYARLAAPRAEDLRFLRLTRVVLGGHPWEIVTPRSGASLAMLPYVAAEGTVFFLLWRETRPSALERRARTPIFDTPVHLRHLNATACFLTEHEAALLRDPDTLAELTRERMARALGDGVRTVRVQRLAAAGEPAPGTSSERRTRVACELDPASLEALPGDVVLVEASELQRAVADGAVRDPVVVMGLLELSAMLGLDPFAAARAGDVGERLRFVETMTAGSIVERRLRSYSSIEREQLGAPTYARLMTLLQHEYGVRVAYPKTEDDRGFFKAAFRVFMAAGRDDDRAKQGLHWSHDAFHFALGNYTVPCSVDFGEWYASGAPTPPAPAPEGPAWEGYYAALKAAEDEATFFSFYTLFAEQPSLARHVGKLTYWQALGELGVEGVAEARAIFDDVTTRATLPARVASHAAYARAEIRGLFDYMLGFRDYHRKDIVSAFGFAARDPYRALFLRYGLYSCDSAAYVASVRAFPERLVATPPGLNPLLAELAEVRVDHALRVWDVAKALRLCRAAVGKGDDTSATDRRRSLLALAEPFLAELDARAVDLSALRSRVVDAELVPKNERTLSETATLGARLADLRSRWWDAIETTALLATDVVREERVRQLPR